MGCIYFETPCTSDVNWSNELKYFYNKEKKKSKKLISWKQSNYKYATLVSHDILYKVNKMFIKTPVVLNLYLVNIWNYLRC